MATSTINQIMNNSGTGYCKMPDGTLIQWGILNVGDIEANSTGAGTFTFPVAFINDNYIAASTSRYTTVASLRATNVAVRTVQTLAVNFHNNYNGTWVKPSADIIAVGRWK